MGSTEHFRTERAARTAALIVGELGHRDMADEFAEFAEFERECGLRALITEVLASPTMPHMRDCEPSDPPGRAHLPTNAEWRRIEEERRA